MLSEGKCSVAIGAGPPFLQHPHSRAPSGRGNMGIGNTHGRLRGTSAGKYGRCGLEPSGTNDPFCPVLPRGKRPKGGLTALSSHY